jgi:hypothetical protein
MKNFVVRVFRDVKNSGVLAGFLFLSFVAYGCVPVSSGIQTAAVSNFDPGAPDSRVRKIFSNWTPAERTDGACQTRHARLILHSDGSREWEVELLSNEAGRHWTQDFHFYDSSTPDATWFGSRYGGAFVIPYANVWTYWRFGRGPGDRGLAEAFDKIKSVVWTGGC